MDDLNDFIEDNLNDFQDLRPHLVAIGKAIVKQLKEDHLPPYLFSEIDQAITEYGYYIWDVVADTFSDEDLDTWNDGDPI